MSRIRCGRVGTYGESMAGLMANLKTVFVFTKFNIPIVTQPPSFVGLSPTRYQTATLAK